MKTIIASSIRGITFVIAYYIMSLYGMPWWVAMLLLIGILFFLKVSDFLDREAKEDKNRIRDEK